ncbi:13648_t:CDS:2 [Ambispora gerdemannii]|uniref:13648_t:CDS:1 n=1 Tax=Ambispora gerdemannii TaxID=144530 RepID=A0A9N9FS54_9GLOM|nr:13648_t:CDS:2 [Ambispora gerdemannii]
MSNSVSNIESENILPEDLSTPSIFISDIIYKILLHLAPNTYDVQYHHEGFKDIYQCLYINRQWCCQTISFLWRQPFNPPKGGFCQRQFCVLMSFLSPSRVASLRSEHNIDLQQSLLYGGNSGNKPIFYYPAYIKYLNYGDLLRVVHTFIVTTDAKPLTASPAMIDALLHTFVEYGAKLNFLEFKGGNSLYLSNYLILTQEKLIPFFSETKKLDLSRASNKSELILYFSVVCQHLTTISIKIQDSDYRNNSQDINTEIIKNTAQLIRAQKGLRKLTICSINDKGINEILDSLHTQTRTLLYLKFYDVDFSEAVSWNTIAECENLESFVLHSCRNNSMRLWKSMIKKDALPRLKYVVPGRITSYNNPELRQWMWQRSLVDQLFLEESLSVIKIDNDKLPENILSDIKKLSMF